MRFVSRNTENKKYHYSILVNLRRKALGIYASDCETSGLIEDMLMQNNPKLHNFCSIDVDSGEVILFEGTQKKELQDWFDQGHTFITHNCKTFDNPALELLGYDTSKIKWIDSLLLSWYLEPTRMRHGLGEYGEEFGVPKPVIEDWSSQTQEEYNHRVREDCRIQDKLWKRQVSRLQELYGREPGSYDRLIAYLMWKGDCLRIQQDTGWKLNEVEALKLQEELSQKIEEKTLALIDVMPKVPVYAIKKRPKKCFQKNGDISALGQKWKDLTDSLGLPFEHEEDIKVVVDMKDGNPASHQQMKDWMFSLNWRPETFKFIREDDGTTREIPQINIKNGEICQSVKDLIPQCAGIEHIAGLGILNHRFSVVKGFLREQFRGMLTASSQGFTNTIRMQHRVPLCNLPSVRVSYGEALRGLLICESDEKLLGSDLKSLEDRLKHHFQWKLDPEYVKTQMKDGFDPHNAIAVMAGLMSQQDADWYSDYKEGKIEHTAELDNKFKELDKIRAAGKSTNYAAQYGAGVKTIARTAKVSEKLAKKLHEGYHKLNWSIAKIASMMTVKKTSFGEWQLNPINKMWYSLRSEKDRFSTLVQGSGSYIFDIWAFHTMKLAQKRGLDFKLVFQAHDELVLRLPEGQEDEYKDLVQDAMKAVNNQVKLNRELACDVSFGQKYSDIH